VGVKNIHKFLGGRVIKTGVSVFITAAICQYFDLPVVFAVIAAIVTIEPTATASVKKGMIRFPAAAIGAGFAMILDYWFGQVPLTYALAAVFTIIVCHRLHWDDAIIVATLTAVAMIPETEESFLQAFFIRLATTSIGIIVSALVNLIVLPPKFGLMVDHLKGELSHKVADLIQDSVNHILESTENSRQLFLRFNQLTKELERSLQLVQYQREELRYRSHSISDIRKVSMQQKELDRIQKTMYHVGNLVTMKPQSELIEKRFIINQAVETILDQMKRNPQPQYQPEEISFMLRRYIRQQEQELTVKHSQEIYFSAAVQLCYELLAIHQLFAVSNQGETTYFK
jgi:uncharacterized membrane protein YgaE (UPF0421/DUF939 family)